MKKVVILFVLLASQLSFADDSFSFKKQNDRPYGVTSRKQAEHTFTSLNSGIASLYKRIAMIRSAKSTLEIEYFMFKIEKESSGRLILQELQKSAKSGVKVRLLIDRPPMVLQFNKYLGELLRTSSVEVRYYNESPIMNLKRVQHRNHRKMLVVDGQEVLIGGRNISDKYFDLGHDYNNLDRDVVVSGPIVSDIRSTFEIYWNHGLTTEWTVPTQPSPKEFGFQTVASFQRAAGSSDQFKQMLKIYLENVEQYNIGNSLAGDVLKFSETDKKILDIIESDGQKALELERQANCQDVEFITDLPGYGRPDSQIHTRMTELMSLAQSSILIENPYVVFQDSDPMLKVLSESKVPRLIMTNTAFSTDNIMTSSQFHSRISVYDKMGLDFRVFLGEKVEGYQYASAINPQESRWGLHSKTVVLDGKTAIYGSYNLDPRSRFTNTELVVICHNSPEVANLAIDDIHKRMSHSSKVKDLEGRLTREVLQSEISTTKKIVFWVVKPLTKWLESML